MTTLTSVQDTPPAPEPEAEQEREKFALKLDLRAKSNDNYRRKCFRIGVDSDPCNEGCVISFDIDEAWGHPNIWSELTPSDARRLAEYLRQAADWAEEQGL